MFIKWFDKCLLVVRSLKSLRKRTFNMYVTFIYVLVFMCVVLFIFPFPLQSLVLGIKMRRKSVRDRAEGMKRDPKYSKIIRHGKQTSQGRKDGRKLRRHVTQGQIICGIYVYLTSGSAAMFGLSFHMSYRPCRGGQLFSLCHRPGGM